MMIPEIEKEINNVTTKRKEDGFLIIEETPETPIMKTTRHDIAAIKAEIKKMEGVVGLWEARIAPLRAIVDEYEVM